MQSACNQYAIGMQSGCSQDAIRTRSGCLPVPRSTTAATELPPARTQPHFLLYTQWFCPLNQQRITSTCWRVRYNSSPGSIQREALLRLVSLVNLGLLPLQLTRMTMFMPGPTNHSCLSFQLTCCITFHDSRFVL